MSGNWWPSRIPPGERMPYLSEQWVEKMKRFVADYRAKPRIPTLAEKVVATARQVVATRLAIAAEARKLVGSYAWSAQTNKPPYPSGTNKCNLFVFEMLAQAGTPVPMFERWSLSELGVVKHPPLAGQWADPRVPIVGWEVVQPPPLVGDVAAVRHDYTDATGHVGIVVSAASTVSVASDTGQVDERKWGFTSDVVYRRYVGGTAPPPEKEWRGRMQ